MIGCDHMVYDYVTFCEQTMIGHAPVVRNSFCSQRPNCNNRSRSATDLQNPGLALDGLQDVCGWVIAQNSSVAQSPDYEYVLDCAWAAVAG